MDGGECHEVLRVIRANWRQFKPSRDTIALYLRVLRDLPLNVVMTAIIEDFGASSFPPEPLQLAHAANRIGHPEESYHRAMSELMDTIARVGYISPEPAWQDPINAIMVARRGGWREVCESTPARGTQEYGRWHAQYREEYKGLATGEMSPQARRSIEGPTDWLGELGM